MSISTRRARVEDAEAIAQLTAQLGYEVEPARVAERLSRILSRDGQEFFVAEDGGEPVGWLHTLLSEYVEVEPFVVIGGLVVDRNHRRGGIGRLLMARAEEWTRGQGCTIVRLWSSEGRTGAHRFYESLGYSHIKTQYSFVKALDGTAPERLHRFVPRIDPQP